MMYDIREHISVLTPSKGSKTKYHCPVCNGDDLDISNDGAYRCFSGNCESKDIRAAIDKLEGKPEWKPEKFVKPIRPKSQKDYFYPDRNGLPLVKVTRKDDGEGKKSFPQKHWNGDKWVTGNPDEVKKLVPIYRYTEIQQAIEQNELIFWVEGEATADLLWGLGIAATTTIGGSGGYNSYGDYKEDLKGARLVLAPDRDSNGVKYIGQVAEDFANQIEGYYLAGSQGLWKKPEGGMDIGDEIRDLGLTKEQILEKVISPDEYQEATAPKPKTDKPKADADAINENGCKYLALAQQLGITLVQDDKGNVKSKLVELTLDLFNLLGDRLKLNLMTNEYEYEGKPLDLNHIKSFISQNLGTDSSTENCIQAVHAIASRFAFHPVRDYLESLKDSPLVNYEVFDNLATIFLGNSDPLANRMMAKTLVGAVARVKKPGTKVDTLTVLQGGQGFMKSTFLKVLAGDSWFCDDIRDLENKDEIAKLARYWLIELAEVDYLMGRKEVESFKRFLSTTADTYRPPYGRSNIRHERTCALFATTNKSEFLKDPTGSRRYWVVRVEEKIDCAAVAKFRDIIWATAVAAYDRGDEWWLNEDDEAQRESTAGEFQEIDPWQDAIENKWHTIPVMQRDGMEILQVDSIFQVLDVPIERRNQASRNRIGAILRNLGFENKAIWFEGKTKKLFIKFISLLEKTGKAGKEVHQPPAQHGIHALPVSENRQVRTGKVIDMPEAEADTPQGLDGFSESLPVSENENESLPVSENESLPVCEANLTRPYLSQNKDGLGMNPVLEPLSEHPNPPYLSYPIIPQTLGKTENSKKTLEIGDRVKFTGTFQEWGIEPGTILTAVEIEDEWVKIHTDARKPMSIPTNLLVVVEVV